jgi:uncharacterized protein YqkB
MLGKVYVTEATANGKRTSLEVTPRGDGTLTLEANGVTIRLGIEALSIISNLTPAIARIDEGWTPGKFDPEDFLTVQDTF